LFETYGEKVVLPLIVDFTGMSKITVQRWGEGRSKPLGIPAIKLYEFFAICDYVVTGEPAITPEIAQINRSLGIGVLTDKHLAKLLNCNLHTLCRILRCQIGVNKQRAQIMREYIAANRRRIETAEAGWRVRIKNATCSPAAESPPQIKVVENFSSEGDRSRIVDALVSILNAAALIASTSIKPGDLTPHEEVHLVHTVAHLFDKLHITAEIIEGLRKKEAQYPSGGAALAKLFGVSK
jgi:hypothetical protein